MVKNIEIRLAGKKGKGIFALKNFKKDEFILYINGRIAETDNPSSLSKDIQNHCFPLGKKNKKYQYILPKSPWKYLNHSCNPNSGIKNNRNIVAMKDIKKGEEIVMDYAMDNIDNWTMKCRCGSKNCRKIISTFDQLDEKTKKKYLPYVNSWVKEKYSIGKK